MASKFTFLKKEKKRKEIIIKNITFLEKVKEL